MDTLRYHQVFLTPTELQMTQKPLLTSRRNGVLGTTGTFAPAIRHYYDVFNQTGPMQRHQEVKGGNEELFSGRY